METFSKQRPSKVHNSKQTSLGSVQKVGRISFMLASSMEFTDQAISWLEQSEAEVQLQQFEGETWMSMVEVCETRGLIGLISTPLE